MATFFYVIDLTQVFNTEICMSIAKKATAVMFLKGIFVYCVALRVIPNECFEGFVTRFII